MSIRMLVQSCRTVLVVAIIALLLPIATSASGPVARCFDDIPKGSWVYKSFDALKRRGFAGAFPTCCYGGGKQYILTRYEGAVLMKRINDDLKTRTGRINNKAAVRKEVDRLTLEFAAEIDAINLMDYQQAKSTSH